MDCQLRGYKLLIVIAFFAIASLMIYGSMLQMNSVGNEATFKDHFRRLIWFCDRDLSDTTKSSNKSISLLEAEFNVEKLQKTKLENIKALNLKLSSPARPRPAKTLKSLFSLPMVNWTMLGVV